MNRPHILKRTYFFNITSILLMLAMLLTVFSVNTRATYSLDPVPGTDEYYYAKYEQAQIQAGWMDTGVANPGPWKLDLDNSGTGTCSAPWDGTSITESQYDALPDVTINNNDGTTVTGKKVSTAEEYRYAVANRCSFQLQNNIDLGGYLHTSTSSRSWNTPGSSETVWTADGNGYTVYNFYLTSTTSNQSMFGQASNLTVQNLRVSNAYVTSQGYNPYALSVFVTNADDVNFYNCGTENTVVYLNSRRNYSAGVYTCNVSGLTMDNCYTRNTHLVVFSGSDLSCSAHMAMGGNYNNITNSYTVDGTVIGNKGHNGGFASCLYDEDNIIRNCFSNIDVYGNVDAGSFIGTQHYGTHIVENCYAAGKVEGTNRLGGFIGSADTDKQSDNLISTIKKCYSASMVGMMSNATCQGSFIGSPKSGIYDSEQLISFTLTDCYAVGEVASLDVDVSGSRSADYKTIGGFLGEYPADGTASITFTNCYYDKQTTAMREWAMGTDGTDSGNGYTTAMSASLGVKGVLTTDTGKSGTGLTSSPDSNGTGTHSFTGFSTLSTGQWEYMDGLYPQLDVFANPAAFTCDNWIIDNGTPEERRENLNSLVKAYSQASVSTVFLETWEKKYDGTTQTDQAVYDTVRDLTLKFYMSSNKDTSSSPSYIPRPIPGALASSEALSFPAFNAIDGQPETNWAGTGTTPWLRMDLGSVQQVDRIKITWPTTENPNDYAKEYRIRLSRDTINWTYTYDYTENIGGVNIIDLPSGSSARYIRMETVTKALVDSWIRIYEFEVFSESPIFSYDFNTAWEKDGTTTTLYGETMDVLKLAQENGEWYADDFVPGSIQAHADGFAPGMEWLTVTCTVNGQKGYRRLRIIPTANLDAGKEKTLLSGDMYDHADEVRLAFSTGRRMNADPKDIITGVFPDDYDTLTEYQKNAQPELSGSSLTGFREADNLYEDVYASHLTKPGRTDNTTGSLIHVKIYESDSNGNALLPDLGVNNTDNEYNDRFNELKPLIVTDDTYYLIEYVWELRDSRYLRSAKLLFVKFRAILNVRYVILSPDYNLVIPDADHSYARVANVDDSLNPVAFYSKRLEGTSIPEQEYTTIKMLPKDGNMKFRVIPIMPSYYMLDEISGIKITTDPLSDHSTWTKTDICDFTSVTEYWVTIYIRPISDDVRLYYWDFGTNSYKVSD